MDESRRFETLIRAEAERDMLLRVLLDNAKLGFLNEGLRFNEEKVNAVLENICKDLYAFKLAELQAERAKALEEAANAKT